MPSVSEWVNQLWFIQTVEYYTALKSNGLSSHKEMRINPKCISLSEGSQYAKATYGVIATIRYSGKGKT